MSELRAIGEIVIISCVFLFMVGVIDSGVVSGVAYVLAGLLVFIFATVATVIVDLFIGAGENI